MNQPLEISTEEFRELGHWLVDRIADHFEELPAKSVSPGSTPAQVRKLLDSVEWSDEGQSPSSIVRSSVELLMNNSLLDGHPRFWGYIIGSGTQIGALADFLAAAVNPNVGGWEIAPMASEIERQTIRWISDWIGFPGDSGGLLVSGGAMANYIGFLTARRHKANWEVRSRGLRDGKQLVVYCSAETHTWIQKAADLFGLGTDAIRWVSTSDDLTMNLVELERLIVEDLESGHKPFLVVGTAGSVSTGVVDDLSGISDICKRFDLWFHVDGAYGGPAAGLEECRGQFSGFWEADSVALDPHKWMYCPQEAGCVIVRNSQHLLDTFSYRPPYYHFEEFDEEPGIQYYEYGMQNSRGFRALKVWMGLLQSGRAGLRQMIANDIRLARMLFDLLSGESDFEVFQTNLSITTFRYVPETGMSEAQLNTLNERLMVELQNGGDVFVTNAVIRGKWLMRACIVNFRTSEEDIRAFPGIVRRTYKDRKTSLYV